MVCHKWTSHLESLLFFTKYQGINCTSLDKAQAAQTELFFTQVEAASKKFTRFAQSTLLRKFLNIDYVTNTNQNTSKTITTKPLQTKRKAIMLQPYLTIETKVAHS